MSTSISIPRSALLEIFFTGYWLAGTGTSRGRYVDEITYRDEYGCPAMPMTQVKGLLRDSARQLAEGRQGNWTDEWLNELFGSHDREAAVRFAGNAGLKPDVAAWFMADPGRRSQLYRILPSTMVGELGAAQDRTLRNIEAAVPMTISAPVTWTARKSPVFDWISLLDTACIATLALGKSKFDGLGRALLSCRAVLQ